LIEQLGGRPTAACGWAAGVERMLMAAPEQPVSPELVDLFVAIGDPADPDSTRTAFTLARQARQAGLRAQLELAGRSVKGQLKHAGRVRARYVAVVDDTTILRDREASKEFTLTTSEVIPTILRGNRLA
jgi:histidyl-tRNA synthetase